MKPLKSCYSDLPKTKIEKKQQEEVRVDLDEFKGLIGKFNKPDEPLDTDPEIQKLFAIQEKLLQKLNSIKLSKQHENMDDEVLGELSEQGELYEQKFDILLKKVILKN